MPPCLCTVRLPHKSGLAEDITVMDFAFDLDDLDPATLEVVAADLDNFFNSDDSRTHELAWYLSTVLSRVTNAASFEFYNLAGHLDGTPHGSPVHTVSWTLAAAGGIAGTNLPAEVCIVGSFHTDLAGILERDGDTRPASRRRGRVYLGPLQTSALHVVASVDVIDVNPALIADLNQSMLELQAAQPDWSVWSRVDADLHNPLVGGWVDNAFDTQRRRGEAPSFRTTWEV